MNRITVRRNGTDMPMSVGFSVRHRAVINRAESRPRP
jgi:hypothetical protein